jgi:hypothetical protein
MKHFKDDILNSEFNQKGFAKFRLLNSTQVKQLKNFYYEDVDEKQRLLTKGGFHTTSNTGDNSLLKKVDAFNKSILMPELDKFLTNVTFTLSNFLVKESTSDSAVPTHQDWLLVDETLFTSFNIWICLDEANAESGGMKFIPGSHLLSKSHRANGKPRFFDEFVQKLEPFFEYVPTSPGDCVIFHHSIIHGSDENKSKKKRLSCVLGGYSSAADFLFYLPDLQDNNLLRKFHIQPETLLNMGPNYEPQVNILSQEKIKGAFESWTFKEFMYRLKKKYPPTTLSLANKLSLLFYSSNQTL